MLDIEHQVVTTGVDNVNVVRRAENPRQTRRRATQCIIVPRFSGFKQAPPFGRKRGGFWFEVVDSDLPLIIVAPGTCNIDWISAGTAAVTVVLVRAGIDSVAIGSRRTAICGKVCAVGGLDFTDT